MNMLVPQFSLRMKEWAYTGFGIVLLSASVGHFNSRETTVHASETNDMVGHLDSILQLYAQVKGA